MTKRISLDVPTVNNNGVKVGTRDFFSLSVAARI